MVGGSPCDAGGVGVGGGREASPTPHPVVPPAPRTLPAGAHHPESSFAWSSSLSPFAWRPPGGRLEAARRLRCCPRDLLIEEQAARGRGGGGGGMLGVAGHWRGVSGGAPGAAAAVLLVR